MTLASSPGRLGPNAALWWGPRFAFLGGAVYLVVESASGVSLFHLRIALVVFGVCSAAFVVRQLVWGHEGATWLVPAGVALVVPGVVLLGIYWFGPKPDALPLVGSVLVLLGLGWLVEAWRAVPDRSRGPHLLTWGAGLLAAAFVVVLVVGGVLLLAPKGGFYVALFVLLGVALFVLLPLGLNLASESGLRWLRGDGSGRIQRRVGAVRPAARLGGLVVLAAGIFFVLWLLAGDWELTAILVGAAVVLVLAIVSDTHADVALVLAGLTLLAAAPAEEVAPEALTAGAGKNILVALGDSYMSGEGASAFFAGTDDGGGDECRRAPSAYAVKVVTAARRFDHVTFFACSGARTYNVVASSDDPADAAAQRGEPGTQIDQLKALGPSFHPALVIISLGGNDAGFSTIGETCLAPGDCSSQRTLFEGNLPDVQRALVAAYTSVKKSLPGVPIVAVPYPQPIAAAEHCDGVALSKGERAFVRGFLDELDARIQSAAQQAGIYYLADMKDSLAKQHLQLCDSRKRAAGVNFLDVASVKGLAAQRFSPLNWLHNSLHPNERGHLAMLTTLGTWLDANANVLARGQEAGSPPAAAVPGAVAEPEPQCSMTAGGDENCKAIARKWMLQQVVGLWLPGLLTLAGLFVLWMASIAVISLLPERRP